MALKLNSIQPEVEKKHEKNVFSHHKIQILYITTRINKKNDEALRTLITQFTLLKEKRSDLDKANLLGVAAEALPAAHETIFPNNSMRVSADPAASPHKNGKHTEKSKQKRIRGKNNKVNGPSA